MILLHKYQFGVFGSVNLFYRPPRALDVFAKIDQLKNVKSVGSDDEENCIYSRKSAACDEKSSKILSYGKEIGVKRLSDVNRERRSMASIVSTEFNTHHRMLLTASVDSTMAFFKVILIYYRCSITFETASNCFVLNVLMFIN